MRLTREMLDYVSQETHEGLCSFPKLQEVLKGHFKSKRVLLILDDVWEDMDDCRWKKLLAPFKSDNAKGNMIIMTTRKPSVAKSRGTTGPINLGALGKDNFWQLFKSCTFGDENYEAHASLSDLGQEISQKLIGNPLAAQTAGALLKNHLTMDHWSNILKTEAWKSLNHTGGIMASLKLSYDELPYHVQLCWSYCSIFPYGYKFHAEELVHFWISQGFVKSDHSSKSLKEMGRYYLTYLVNLGMFEEVERERFPLDSQTQSSYVMCGLMHDFGRLVSRSECAILDGLQCNENFPTARHLSIVTSSVYRMDDQTGNILRNKKLEFFLQNIVTSVRKLRTLVLIGEYESFFFKAFKDVFEKAHNLRLLQMSGTSADFNSFLCSLVNPTHLRYLKLQDGYSHPCFSMTAFLRHQNADTEQKALPNVMSNFFHLQVLDVAFFVSLHTVHLEDFGGWRTLPSLAMLRFLKRLKLHNLQRIREVSVPPLEELVLDRMPDLQRCSCTSVGDMKSSLRVLEILSCHVLEVFDLFQKGHNCEIEHKPLLPSLRKLIMCECPLLQVQIALPPSATFSELLIRGVSTITKMEGSSMKTFMISFFREASLEALDNKILAFHNLQDIKYLQILSCGKLMSISFNGLSQLNSLKSLKIANCMKLFSSDDVPEQTQEDMITANDVALPALESLDIRACGITGKWLSLMLRHSPSLKELDLYYCPQLKQLKIDEKGKVQSNLLPAFEASSSGYLYDASSRYAHGQENGRCLLSQSGYLPFVDGIVHIPLNLRKITIGDCPHLIVDDLCTRPREDFAGFPSVEEEDGQENGRCLLAQSLEQLVWSDYPRKALRPCFVGNLTCLKKLNVRSGSLEYLQLDSCTALEDLEIHDCNQLVTVEGMQSLGSLRSLKLSDNSRLKSLQLHSCTSLECLEIEDCRSLVTIEGKRSLGILRSLKLSDNSRLKSLQLYSCTSLERLEIEDCRSLVTIEGLRSMVNLKHLEIIDSPALDSLTALESYEPTEGISSHIYELFPALERLEIDDLSPLNTSFCKSLICLRSLKLSCLEDATRLTDEQERALLLLRSLQELCFFDCADLVHLPTRLHRHPSLNTLEIIRCKHISGLPNEGLPPSLEKLAIRGCNHELSNQCRLLATRKLEVEVKIDVHYAD